MTPNIVERISWYTGHGSSDKRLAAARELERIAAELQQLADELRTA